LHKDRRQLLDAACTGDGRPLPHQLKAEILREIELIELLVRQIADVEAAREILAGPKAAKAPSPVVLLEQLKGIGPGIASVLYLEGLFRSFGNRRQLAAYVGLAPTPWRSGTIDQEQGISKAGWCRLASRIGKENPACGNDGQRGDFRRAAMKETVTCTVSTAKRAGSDYAENRCSSRHRATASRPGDPFQGLVSRLAGWYAQCGSAVAGAAEKF
jgi:transposase